MTITIQLQSFLDCVTYHYPCLHTQVSQEVADAIQLADPTGELCYLEPMNGCTALPYNLWTAFAWRNEKQRREYLVNLFKEQKPIPTPKQSPAKIMLEQQLTEAKRLGNNDMANALEMTLKHL